MRKTVRPFHKLEFYWTDAVEGKYDIPIIKPIYEVEDVEWIGFNYAKTEPHPENKGCHFFLDDYQFERVWNRPYLYLPILKRFKYVTAPAFSFYRDVSYAVSIYNHYRKHFLLGLDNTRQTAYHTHRCSNEPGTHKIIKMFRVILSHLLRDWRAKSDTSTAATR